MRNIFYSVFGIFLLFSLSACGSSVKNVQFKINTEPEGAHLVYRQVDKQKESTADWIYLGNTPFRGVRVLDEKKISDTTKITLKVMHAGYYDQVKEWSGQSFIDEAEERGNIFWTPYLVAHPKKF